MHIQSKCVRHTALGLCDSHRLTRAAGVWSALLAVLSVTASHAARGQLPAVPLTPSRSAQPFLSWHHGKAREAAKRPLARVAVDAEPHSDTSTSGETTLDSLIVLAQRANPDIKAAAARVVAAHATIGPAGARPDPMLMAGVLDFAYGKPGYSDNFTMNMLRVTQTFPFPGKLSIATRAAEEDAVATGAMLAQQQLDVERDVRDAYYELAFVQRARAIVQRNAEVLGGLARITEAQYEVGRSAQADVLRARVEVARLGDEAASLDAQERSALARLNAVLDRPSETPVGTAVIPEEIVRLAVPDSTSHIHFESAALGAAVTDSPLLPTDSLVALAITNSPMLQAHEARIRSQGHRVELAQKARLPDFDISLEYDQRPHFRDYVSFFVSVPLRLQQRRKQDQEVVGAKADLRALEAQHLAEINALRREIATRVSDVERERTQLGLSLKAVLPQARATFTSATTSYQVGRVDFTSLVDAQAAVFNYETVYWRSLADFAKAIAELRRTVGAEVLR